MEKVNKTTELQGSCDSPSELSGERDKIAPGLRSHQQSSVQETNWSRDSLQSKLGAENRHGGRVIWDPSNVERLRALWNEGLSGSEISARIPDTTRNGILGKAWRLGLPSRADGRPQPRKEKPHHWRKSKFGNGPQAKPKGPDRCSSPSANLAPPIEVEPVEINPAVETQTLDQCVSLLDLEPGQCRWPLGVGEAKFCGRPTCNRSHGSYCHAHAALAFAGGIGKQWAEDDPRRAKLSARFRQMNAEHRQALAKRKTQ